MIGTGAISHKHALAYRNIGYRITVCTDIFPEAGRKFAATYGAEFVPTYEEVCKHPDVDFVDVCTFPDFRLQPIEIAAAQGKAVQVQKPISTNLETARRHRGAYLAERAILLRDALDMLDAPRPRRR